MNKCVIFVISLLFSISFVTSRSKDTESYDNLFIALTEVNQAAGLEDDKVYEMVSQISNTISESYDNFQTLAQSYLSKCKLGDQLITSQLSNIKRDISAAESLIYQSGNDIQNAKEELKGYYSDLKKSKKETKELKSNIENHIKNYAIYASEAEEKLVTIQTLQNMINDELVSKHLSKPGFVQLRDCPDKIKSLRNNLVSSMTNYNPIEMTMVGAMITMAQSSDFSNKKMLYKLLHYLEKLENNLQDFRNRQEVTGNKILNNTKLMVKGKLSNIKELEDIISKKNSQIVGLEKAVSFAKTDLVQLKKNLVRKSGESKFWDRLCDHQRSFEKRFSVWKDIIEKSLIKASEDLNLQSN